MKYLRELKYESVDQILWISIKTESIEKELIEESPYWDAWQQKVEWDDRITNIDEVAARYKEKASIYKEFSKLTGICYGRVIDGQLKVKEIASEDEKQLIEEFFSDVENVIARGVKFLGGFGILNFAVPFISFRAMVNDIPMINSFDVAAIAPWNIKHVIDVQNLLRGTSTTMISLLGATAGFNLPQPKEDILSGNILASVNLFCKYAGLPQAFLTGFSLPEEKELPLLEKLYQQNYFTTQIKQELEKLLKKKKPTKKDKEALKEIIYSVYVRTSFATNDEDKKEIKEQKLKEVEDFVNNL